MEMLVDANTGDVVSEADTDVNNQLFQIGAVGSSSDHPEEGSVVILRSNPLLLPMVCGLCGSQYATARELESHLDMHREGLHMKKPRGRPKGSKAKKSEDDGGIVDGANQPITAVITDKSPTLPVERATTSEENTESRQTQRIIKKPSSDIFIPGDNELDDLLRAEDTFSRQNLPQYTSDGVQIARLEDYVSSKVIVLQKHSGDADIMTDNDLSRERILQSAIGQPVISAADGSTQILDESLRLQAEEAMTALIGSNDLSTAAETSANSTNLHIETVVNTGDSEESNITHIEVCLEGGKEGSMEDNTEAVQAKTKMCELCCVVLATVEMKEHMINTHMKGSNQEFHCPRIGCNQLFTTIPRLRLHLSEHHTPLVCTLSPQVYPCMVLDCNTIHKSKHALKMHMSDVHSAPSESATTCNVCNKVFKSKRAQSSHMKAHTKALEPVRCEKCFKEFRHPSALKFHMSMMPNCDKPKYVCSICGYKAVTPWRLNSHQKQVHSTNRPYTCEYCQKTYKTNEMLRQHTYKLHTGTPSFECQVCHKKFFYAAELREHSQLHSTTKQFVCPICHRAFKTMHVFRGHMNGKHSDTWYSCGFCKFTTSHKKSMKRHMVLVHKLKNVTLEVTPEEPQHQQVEVIQGDGELHSLQLSDNGQVINSMQQIQYEDVGSVVIQTSNGELISHEQLSGEVIAHGEIIANDQIHVAEEIMTNQQITEEQMDDDSFRQLINNHHAAVDDTMNASEVSEVLVSLSGVGTIDKGCIPPPVATDTVISTATS